MKVTAVRYLNTKPLLYGIVQSTLAKKIDLQLDIPSVCAEKLADGRADLGLVPVAIIPQLKTPYIISDYCIGTVGAVKTVAIFSDCPLEELTHIYLDHHSRTSVALVKLLIEKYWKLNPVFLSASDGYIDKIGGTVGGLIIGDRTIDAFARFPYIYDLGKAWHDWKGLPFVFAAWVSNRPLKPAFIQAFNAALKKGIEAIPQLMYLLPSPHPDFDLEEYFTKFISYKLDKPKRRALSMFLEEISETLQPSLEESLLV